jgi:hypothetical protein
MKALLAAFLFALAGFAAADGARITSADVAEIRAVIHRQIDAFRRDDAKGAFALVSPEMQAAFGTPERFLEAVRTGYRPVYRPLTVSFLDLIVMGGEVVQQVQIADHGGGLWVAFYAMQRQRDGSWRTNGCHLMHSARTFSA